MLISLPRYIAPFDPNLVPGLVRDWDFSKVAVADGLPIPSVADQSTVGDPLVQALTAKQMTMQAAGQNGLNVAIVDGIDDFYSFTRVSDIGTVFWCMQELTPKTAYMLGDTTTYHFARGSGTHMWWPTYAHVNIKTGVTRINGAVVDGTITPPPSSFGIVSLVTAGPVQANQLQMDRAGGVIMNGKYGRVIIYNRALTTAEHDYVLAGLKKQWGVA